jgi:hypothetical protein
MSVLETKTQYALILADIATAAALSAHVPEFSFGNYGRAYVPGSLRERWLASAGDAAIRSRVAAMATAAAGSLQAMSGNQLVAAAEKYSIVLEPAVALGMADYFEAKRNAVLTYNR